MMFISIFCVEILDRDSKIKTSIIWINSDQIELKGNIDNRNYKDKSIILGSK